MTGTYRRPRDVAMVPGSAGDPDGGSDTLYLSHLPSGSLVVLRGTGALIYTEAVNDRGHEPKDDVAARLADAVGMTAEAIRDDVEAFIVELVKRGLLEET